MNRQYKWLLLVFTLVFSQGCSDFLDINENPNVATEPPINGLLGSASYQTALNHYRVANFTSYFAQYLASPNAGSATDTYDQADYSSAWSNLYNTMTDVYDMVSLGEEQGGRHHAGIGKVLQAINLGLTADAWGAAPFSDAFTGETLTPGYDGQEQVYTLILDLLDEALVDLEASDNQLAVNGPSDFIHGGDIDAWIKTVHALKARYLNHFSKQQGSYNPATILAEVDKAYTSNDDDAQITVFEIRNPWAQAAINNENLLLDGWLSENFINHLNGATYGVVDPRLPLITEPTPAGEYVGTRNGAGRRGDGVVQEECYLETSGAYSGENSPLLIMTYAELKFIEAEAALADSKPDRAFTAFQDGLKANMDKVGVVEEDYNTYYAASYPGLGAGSLTLGHVLREKYAAMFLHPEAWVDARRYDYNYKDFMLPENANLSEFIRRVQYPSIELDRNRDNVPTVNSLAERLFWDK